MRMRRTVGLALALWLIIPAVSAAQGVGIKGGLLYSSFNFSDFEDIFDSRTGWMAGVFFGERAPGLQLAGELNFLSKNGKFEGEDFAVRYLQIPVFARGNFGSDSAIGYVFAGPNFDIKVGEGKKVTLFNEYNGFDIGLTGGGGVELGPFIIEARGTWGFRNIAKDFGTSDLKTRSFAGLVGLRFN